ncbi:zinc finger protein 518B isoform X2 [Sarcophilus harrisii]|uniref:Zinc finger protein 518B n=1 Tax=Sarcophilus harrisii TaxID=9305 RepID=A0A7N4V7Y8_SARHA|nr:zinc finger protein 518B isoform X2 [Sarcophilus harrisii]
MPGTEHAEDCIPGISLTEGLELNTQLFLEMQIKKMKEIIPQLYTNQVNDRNNSLTTSPKQLDSEHVNQPNGHEAQPNGHEAHLHGYQERRAEDDERMSIVTCMRCRSVQKIPLEELKKDQMFFACVKCNLGISPPFPSLNDVPNAIDSGNKDNATSRTITNQFKVKNFQPGKYYCDKCRFSTKDALQYKKHTLQHEDVRFFCSHCSYVSYTKGEFQRHLVKHTGTFPYQCEYCDYGAVRNDYIVKHTRRVHETSGEKRPFKQTLEYQSKRISFSKPNSEVFSEVPKSGSFLNEPSDLSLCFPGHGDQDRADCDDAIPFKKSKECSKEEAASAPDQACLPEPSKVNFFENENIEVELLSPAKEAVKPGVPLTVVAPAELKVPDNCLAQLIDVKVVNGTQQLVLKLIPLKEKSGFAPGSKEGKYELVSRSTVPNEREKLVPTEQALPAVDRSPEKPLDVNNLHCTDYTQVKDLSRRKTCVSQVLKNKAETYQSPCRSCPNRDRIGEWRQEVPSVPYRAAPLSPVSSRDGDMKQNKCCCSLSVMNSGTLCSPLKRSGVLPHLSALSPHQDRSPNHLEKSLSTCKPAEAIGTFAERGNLPVSPRASLHRNEVGSFKMVAFSKSPKQAQAKEPSGCPNRVPDSSLHGEQSHITLIGENDNKTQDPEEIILEDLMGITIQNSESTSSDGPVISSVFSLSSGIENIPEGIKWDDASCSKTTSVSSLHRKFAQLVAATDSSAPSLSTVEQLSLPLGTPIDYVLGHTALNLDPRPHRELQNNVAGIEQFTCQQMQGQHSKEEAGERRKGPDARPSLGELSSTEKERLVESKQPCDAFGNKRLSPTSVSFNFLEQVGEDLSLTNKSQSTESSRNLGTSLENKPNQELTASTVFNQSNSACSQPKETIDKDQQEKMSFNDPTGSKIKTKQAVIAKKKTKLQSDSSNLLPDVCIFMTSRHLRLMPVRTEQLIKCPRRNQPVVVLNHPDVDSVEVINVMKVVNKYKGNVLKVVLSERTCDQLGVKRHHSRLIYQNTEAVFPVKKQTMLKMKLKKIHKNSYQVQRIDASIWAEGEQQGSGDAGIRLSCCLEATP